VNGNEIVRNDVCDVDGSARDHCDSDHDHDPPPSCVVCDHAHQDQRLSFSSLSWHVFDPSCVPCPWIWMYDWIDDGLSLDDASLFLYLSSSSYPRPCLDSYAFLLIHHAWNETKRRVPTRAEMHQLLYLYVQQVLKS